MDVIIRKAVKSDMKSVHKMIVELAQFEKMENQVKINPDTLMQDLCGENATIGCFVAELTEKTLIGYAIYYTCYSTWLGKSIFLEDIYVQEAHRQLGVGKRLFKAVARLAHETSGRLDFHVLGWNPAKEFYLKCGAVNLSEQENWELFRMNSDSLNKLLG